jgi:hypothetical protein
VPHPFSDELGARLYRTGDRVRYLADGSIEFIGRLDHQVKIRGFRIELGEIEAVLRQHPDVQEVVVLCREDVPGDKLLVAYMVMEEDSAPASGDLCTFVGQRLPAYMVPAAFVVLSELPLTPNRKIDRDALPVPERSCPELQTTYQAPRTEIERTIASVWQEVLDLEKVGLRDNFFDLGGHSLLLARAYDQLREVLRTPFSLVTLFQYPTVGALADHLVEKEGDQGGGKEGEDWAEKLHAGKNRLLQLHACRERAGEKKLKR